VVYMARDMRVGLPLRIETGERGNFLKRKKNKYLSKTDESVCWVATNTDIDPHISRTMGARIDSRLIK